MKDDPAEEEILWNVANHYQQSIDYKFNVKKWIGNRWKKPIIECVSQVALFKCMHPACIYSTDERQDMAIHMNSHLTFMKVIARDTAGALPKTTRDQQIKFRDCCYCDFEAHYNDELLEHIVDEHSRSIFQCSYCFYRCIEVDNIISHYKALHPAEKREILLCGDSKEFTQQDYEMMKDDCENHVEKFKCGQGKRTFQF